MSAHLSRVKAAMRQGQAWWWHTTTGSVRIGVLECMSGSWIVGHVLPNGSRRKLNSAQLSRYHPSTDPERLLGVVQEWARKRNLQEVEW